LWLRLRAPLASPPFAESDLLSSVKFLPGFHLIVVDLHDGSPFSFK